MNTPRMQEAWDKSSRTTDGFYSSQTPASEYAISCYDEGCKLERELADAIRERDEARGQRDRLAELHNKNAIHFNELLELCGTLRKVSRAASVLIASKGRHNTMLAYNGLRDALQSLTPDEPISNQ